jgi:hypothetical protein
MKKEINEIAVSMELTLMMFAYNEKNKHYSQLVKNEGEDKYILCIDHNYNQKQKVEVFRLSEIKDPELRKRTYLLDQGHLVWCYSGNSLSIYFYLSETKRLIDDIGIQVREMIKPLNMRA